MQDVVVFSGQQPVGFLDLTPLPIMYTCSTLLFRCGCVMQKMAKFVCDPVRMTVVGPADIVFIKTFCAVGC
jgi:hypothetical protein